MNALRRTLDVAAAIVVVAAITMLVRPSSNGPQLVEALGDAFVSSATAAIGTTTK